MMRWMTAGESHGRCLTTVVDGVPAGLQFTTDMLAHELRRRRLGYGRGTRQLFEQDEVTVTAGVRHGITLGSPLSITIGNSEWPKWEVVMSADPVAEESLLAADDVNAPRELARNRPLTRPRPGHADLAGMTKYGWSEARPILERASARETAARTAAGTLAKALLRQAAGIEIYSHTVALGAVHRDPELAPPAEDQLRGVDDDPVRSLGGALGAAMVAAVEEAKAAGETLGGVVEVVAERVPVGLGSHVQWDRKLDARLAGAVMSIPAIKGVEIGQGWRVAALPGSQAHDELIVDAQGAVRRETLRAGGVEGGISVGGRVVVRAAMKPISTVPRPLRTIDITTGEPAVAHHQRSDVCAVPAAGVVAETMVALVLADALLEKCGGDHVHEIQRNLQAYLESVPNEMRVV